MRVRWRDYRLVYKEPQLPFRFGQIVIFHFPSITFDNIIFFSFSHNILYYLALGTHHSPWLERLGHCLDIWVCGFYYPCFEDLECII